MIYGKIERNCIKGSEIMTRKPKLIKFPADLADKIEKYKNENHLSSFSAAVYELIRKGLDRDSKK